jgi:hypothetical protein
MILQQNSNTIYAAEGSVEAGTEGIAENGNYKLSITEGTPSYSPKVPKLSDRRDSIDAKGNPVAKNLPNDITAKFKVALEFCPPQGKREDVARRAKNTTITIAAEDKEFIIKKAGTWNTTYSTDHCNFTHTQDPVPKNVNIVLRAFTPGEKTVTLSIETTINNVTLETSKKIKISVPDYTFTVYLRKGQHDKSGTYSIPETYKSGDKLLDVGHLAWKVNVYENQLNNFDPDIRDYANHVWGLGPTPPPKEIDVNHKDYVLYNVDRALFAYMYKYRNESSRNRPAIDVSVYGTLYKNGSKGEAKVNFSFTDTKDDKDKDNITSALVNATTVLNYTNNIINDVKNEKCRYQVPRFNCVDQVISSMSVGNLPAPENKPPNMTEEHYMSDGITPIPDYEKCKRDYKLSFPKFSDKGNFLRRIDYNMRLSVPQLFVDQYK